MSKPVRQDVEIYEQRGFVPPRRCPPCRRARRDAMAPAGPPTPREAR